VDKLKKKEVFFSGGRTLFPREGGKIEEEGKLERRGEDALLTAYAGKE